MRTRLEENFLQVFSQPETDGRISQVNGFEDLCPTVFSICDGIAEFAPSRSGETSMEVAHSRGLAGLQDERYVMLGGPEMVQYYVAKLYLMLLESMKKRVASEVA
jgi:hypothetical protein